MTNHVSAHLSSVRTSQVPGPDTARVSGRHFWWNGQSAPATRTPGLDVRKSLSCNAFSPSEPCVRPVHTGDPCVWARRM